MRPLLVSAACSGIAALALVISEGAVFGVHLPRADSGAGASAPHARSGGAAADNAQGSAGTFDTGATPSPDSQTDQQPGDQPPSGGGSGQPSSGGGGVDPGGLAQMLPVPPPIKVGP